jgi:pimeloyl-ACP methyl ester carboxylesterase
MDTAPTLVFLHGTAGDRSDLAHQEARFADAHRVLSIDFPGHGASGARGPLNIQAFAASVEAELSRQGVAPGSWVAIGHSLGGLVALELAARSPLAPAACVMIDAPMLIPQRILQALSGFDARFRSEDEREAKAAIREFAEAFYFHAEDEPGRRARLLKRLLDFPVSAFNEISASINSYGAEEAVRRCQVPLFYIQASVPADVERLAALNPLVQIAKTSRPSHYAPLELASEVNDLIAAFLAKRVLRRSA